jgi:hypothetical protein
MCDFKQFIEGCAARRVHKTRTAWCTADAICGAVLPALRKRLTTPKRTTRLLPLAWNFTSKRQFLSSSKMAIASACLRNSRSSSRMVSAMHHSTGLSISCCVCCVFVFVPPTIAQTKKKEVYSQGAVFVLRIAGNSWCGEQQFISKQGACFPSRTLSVLPNAGNGLA